MKTVSRLGLNSELRLRDLVAYTFLPLLTPHLFHG